MISRVLPSLLFAACALDGSIEDSCRNLPPGASREEVRTFLGPEAFAADEGSTHTAYFGDYPRGCLCLVVFDDRGVVKAEPQNCN